MQSTPETDAASVSLDPEDATAPETAINNLEVASSDSAETRFLKWAFVGRDGIRVGWSVLIFFVATMVFLVLLGILSTLVVDKMLHAKLGQFTAVGNIRFETMQFLALLGAAWVSALIEKRRVVDYNLSGRHRLRHFLVGILVGFVALSALVGTLYEGGWIRFGQAALSGAGAFEFAGLWGIAFLLTGLSEEGMTRCYMLYTLTRGINYWWALGTVASFSLFAFLNPQSNGSWGVYAMALLGVVPCLWLHLRKAGSAGFWEAAWLTSTFFGYIHTFNAGETWMGIFSAAAIGLIFCVSVKLTGSAWWAIGYHASWDWAQTYFYGTPDSGFAAKGHYLTTNPAGPPFWSGGVDGPEGSALVLGSILLTLVYLVVAYRPGGIKSAPAALA